MLIAKTIAECNSCEKRIEDEVLLINWYPTWSSLATKIREKGWKMKLSKDKKDWDIYCSECK